MADGIRSPCIRKCFYDAKKEHCCGCYRDRDAISNWWKMTDAEKRVALKKCKENRKKEKV